MSLSFIKAFSSTAWKCWRAASCVGVTLLTAKVTLWEKLHVHREKHNQQFSTKCHSLVKQNKARIARRGLFLLFVQNTFLCIYSEGVIPVINAEEYLQVTYSVGLDLRR